MASYKFSIGRVHGKSLEGIVPGEILVDTVALALRDVYPDVLERREKWLRGAVAQFLVDDAEKIQYPVFWLQEDDNTILASMTVWRVVEPVMSIAAGAQAAVEPADDSESAAS
ncbi:hypothetical protein AWC17_25155 [Mycobacterium nebraskense]|uniref:Uncharacterized protein n=1 Tax=Mycobacterium nebraskense TaxID=244292 RepID=A0A1X1ZZE3_9MYCO|nr:hypothetical protein [Mycobacterium nebraskense]ORW32698.1 hypothetical protein AWC17_25155 [Mycobacterium nebraskense]